jgi:hypothetical protein
VLVADKLLFLLEVLHNLSKRLFENLDFALEELNFLGLQLSAGIVLVYGAEVEHVGSLGFAILGEQALLVALAELECVPLRDGLLSELLVLLVDVLLDVEDVSLGVPLRLLLEQLELGFSLQLEALLLLG